MDLFTEAIKGFYFAGLVCGIAFNAYVFATRSVTSLRALDFAFGLNCVVLTLGVFRLAVNDPTYNPMWIGGDVVILAMNRWLKSQIDPRRK